MPPAKRRGSEGLTILISGASGLIGTALQDQLRERGHNVHTLVRRSPANPSEHRWNPVTSVIESGIIDHSDVVVNLSGASIGRIPWTAGYKKLILSSRVNATTTLVEAINASKTPPSLLVHASAVGFYGDRGDEDLTEEASAGGGYLAEVTQAWEAAAAGLKGRKTSLAIARTGLVIARSGAMAPLRLQTLLGAAGPIGSGNQWWPWISLRDEVGALTSIIEDPLAGGIYNLVGPQPATSREITRELSRQMGRPHWLGLPSFAISLLMGQAGRELLLSSQKVRPAKLLAKGFQFTDSNVSQAIAEIT